MCERIDYLTEKDTRMVGDHLYRYWLALREINDNFNDHIIYDVACGLGYGTDLLSRNDFVTVIGYDKLEKDNIQENIIYRQVDLNNYKFENNADVLVSFETIEHLENPQNLIKQFGKFRKVILSTPIIPTKHTNSAHLQDFTLEEVIGWFAEDVWKIKWQRIQNGIYIILCAEKI